MQFGAATLNDVLPSAIIPNPKIQFDLNNLKLVMYYTMADF
jgi:hypothetical protein